MFSEVVNLYNKNDDEIIELLYEIFKNDFILNRTYLAQRVYIDPMSDDIETSINKEKIFWHVISRKNRGTRRVDKPRACRINWIRPMILNYNHVKIKLFYHYEDNNKIRLYLWAYDNDFAVILQKIGSRNSSYVVTSFYIDNQNKRDAFERKFIKYQNSNDTRLESCEWF